VPVGQCGDPVGLVEEPGHGLLLGRQGALRHRLGTRLRPRHRPDGDVLVLRLYANGTLDTAFDGDGIWTADIGSGTSDEGRGIVEASDGDVLVGGSTDEHVERIDDGSDRAASIVRAQVSAARAFDSMTVPSKNDGLPPA